MRGRALKHHTTMSLFSKKYDVAMIRTTSKDALKRSALFVCEGDIKTATEIYDFFVRDMPNMPDYDSVQPTLIDQAKDTIGDVLGWVDQNQDKLVNYWNLFQQFRGGGSIPPATPPANLPPI